MNKLLIIDNDWVCAVLPPTSYITLYGCADWFFHRLDRLHGEFA